MIWRSEWAALAARIDALIDASRFLMIGDDAAQWDPHQCVARMIMPEARGLKLELAAFYHRRKSNLPASCHRLVENFLADGSGIVPDAGGSIDLMPIVAWRLFRSQFDFYIRDNEQTVASLTERAFAHLQRLIVADDGVRKTWEGAFSRGEESCEKLGGAHLLLHGIYAFKARGSGTGKGSAEATDLVFQEPAKNTSELERIAEGIVLTEWKRVLEPRQLEKMTEQAIKQAHLYGQGVFGGLELRRTRYIIAVTRDFSPEPYEERRGDVVYKRLGLNVSPDVPSKIARRC